MFPGENEPEGCNLNAYFEKYSPPQHRTPTPLGPPAEGGASRVVTEILSGKAAGQHAYKDPQSDADTNNHDFINSSVQCVVLAGKVWSESTSEAFQRLCPTTTFVPTTAVGHAIEEAV